jgi:hypothetical protein
VRRWFRRFTVHGAPRRRQQSQGLVEYGMIVTCVAFVAMVGLNFVGHAEEALLGGEPLAAATPVPGFFLNRTSTVVSCNKSSITVDGNAANNTVNCIATVTDLEASPLVPNGQIVWTLDSNPPTTCSPLIPASSSSATCTWTHIWSHGEAVPPANPHTLTANYLASTGHRPSNGGFSFTVLPKVNFTWSCTNPWILGAPYVEVGHPYICSVMLQDASNGNAPYPGVSVSLSSLPATGNGVPWFSCFVGNSNPYSGAGSITDPACAAAATWTCTTDASGFCAKFGQTQFEYRRTYDDMGGMVPFSGPGNDHLTATTIVAQPNIHPIRIVQGLAPFHPTGMLAKCSPNANVVWTDPVTVRNAAMQSDSHLVSTTGGSLTVTCTASVMDIDPNTPFDYPTCSSGDPRVCLFDDTDAFAPLGQVNFAIYNEMTSTLISTITCQLGHLGARPSNLPDHTTGQIDYASWCPQSIVFPIGNWKIETTYNGQAFAHYPSGAGGSFQAPDVHVDVS